MFSLQKRILLAFILSSLLNFSCNQDINSANQSSITDSLTVLAKKYPDSIKLQMAVQESIYNNGDTIQALQNLEKLSEIHPQNEEVHNALAVIHLQRSDTSAALLSLMQSLSINQNQPEIEFELAFIEAARKNKAALLIADRIISRYTEPDIQAKGHFTKGIFYANMAQIDLAVPSFDSAIIKNFTLIDAYIEKAILLLESGEPTKTIATLSKAIALDKNNADLFFWMGKAYQQKKEYKQALLYFSETIKIDPTNKAAQTAIEEIKK